MDVRELRIGNYFQWKEVASMGSGIAQITHGQQIEDYITLKEGVPLTPEWLERFGFENIGTDDYHSKPMFKKHGCDWKYCLEGYFSQYFCQGHSEPAIVGDIQYVHQLQNAYFLLTGEELTIKEPVEK